jgi:CRP-like cAMP-binding protein
LCGAILEFSDRYGSVRDGVREVLIPMGQGDLGSWNGLSREAVVKGLKSLRGLRWIEGDGRQLRILDEDSLRDRAAV